MAGVRDVLESAAEAQGVISRDYLDSQLRQLYTAIRAPLSSSGSSPGITSETQETQIHSFAHSWASRLRRIPEGFSLPSVDIMTAFHLWFLGNPAQEVGPYRFIEGADFVVKGDAASRAQAKKFSKWRVLLSFLEDKAVAKDPALMNALSPASVQSAFEAIEEDIPRPPETRRKRKRRVGHLKVHTVFNLVFQGRRNKRARLSRKPD